MIKKHLKTCASTRMCHVWAARFVFFLTQIPGKTFTQSHTCLENTRTHTCRPASQLTTSHSNMLFGIFVPQQGGRGGNSLTATQTYLAKFGNPLRLVLLIQATSVCLLVCRFLGGGGRVIIAGPLSDITQGGVEGELC